MHYSPISNLVQFISFAICISLTSCTTVQVLESGAITTERYFGIPLITVNAGSDSLTAVRLHGFGFMVSDSIISLGYLDEFSIKKELNDAHCSMIILVENQAESLSLLKEIESNKDIYINICAVKTNLSQGIVND
ncbi:hypothetical protein ACE017_16895 [Shewanella mangrovisoli]|uniref:hypothetical protein n=1 Tax=Shewanella mangrovisoli TaxID=2864211 RepID=UPI0035B9234F